MTHSGGQPHEVGDRDQRYEVTFFDPMANARRVLGWSDTAEGALSMMEAIELHPSWQFPQLRDREAKVPRLFYWEESENAWVPAPDKIQNIIDAENFIGHDDMITITFKRLDLTDAEFDALPEG